IGFGEEDKLTAEGVRQAAAAFVKAAWKDTSATLAVLDVLPPSLERAAAAQALVEGAALAAYQFTKYKADPKACRLESVAIVGGGAAVPAAIERGAQVAEAVALAR